MIPGAPDAARAGGPRPGAASLDVLVLRDPRESRAKCSLTPLRGREGIRFVDYSHERRVDAAGRVLLDPAGEPLGPEDRGLGLLLIDCSWRRLAKLARVVDGAPLRRRLPPLVSGYPRRSKTFEDPAQGLASVEALCAALALLGRPCADLLDGYPWRGAFLERNPLVAAALAARG